MGPSLLLVFLFLTIVFQAAARADDFGPASDVRRVRGDGHVLLAHRARVASVDPKAIAVSDVVVVKDAALFSWDVGKEHGVMGLTRSYNRWWDVADADLLTASSPCRTALPQDLTAAAAAHNADVQRAYRAGPLCQPEAYRSPEARIAPSGGRATFPRMLTAGYQIDVAYAKHDPSSGASVLQLYARAPTSPEMAPYPWYRSATSDALVFFDFTFEAPRPVAFEPGTTIDVWFPFVLDDNLHYRLLMQFDKPVEPICGTLRDNVAHFELPAFVAAPGKTMMAEIDGDPHC